MNTHADKTQEDQSQSVSAVRPDMRGSGESAFQFVDNRPEAIAQRRLEAIASNSPQVSQLRAFQDMANKSLQVKQSIQLQTTAESNNKQQHQPIQKKENGIIQRLEDGSGVAITLERIEGENNLDTLKEWAILEPDWEDFDIMEAIKEKIKTLEPAPLDAEVPVPVAEDEQEAVAPMPVAVEKPKKPMSSKARKIAERRAKRNKQHALKKPAPKKAERAPLPAGTVYQDQLPKKSGTNKTRSWGKYPHVSVLLGTINPKNQSVKLLDFHYSLGESDTHLHWIAKGGGTYEFVDDTSRFTPEGIELLRKAYSEVKKRAEKLGCVALEPAILSN